MLRTLESLALAGCLVALAACSGGPSDGEVEAAMKARVNEMDSGSDAAPVVTAAKNTGCRSTGDAAYTCDVEVDMTMPGVGNVKSVAQLRMVQDGGRWTYDRQQVLSMQGQSR